MVMGKVTFLHCGLCGKIVEGSNYSFKLPKLPSSTTDMEYWQNYHTKCFDHEAGFNE